MLKNFPWPKQLKICSILSSEPEESRELFSTQGRFNGQRVLVSGSTGTLGRLASLELARLGATVICAGRNAANLQDLLDEMPNGPHEILLSTSENSESLAEVTQAHSRENGGFDAIVLMTGKIQVTPSNFASKDALEALWAANYSIPIAYASAFLSCPRSKNSDRVIVAVSSISAVRPQPGLAAYGASKAALETHLLTMGKEFASRGVRVNIVRGGLVASPMAEKIHETVGPEKFDLHVSSYPLGIGATSSLIDPILFALSPRPSWMAGSIMTVDGGYTL